MNMMDPIVFLHSQADADLMCACGHAKKWHYFRCRPNNELYQVENGRRGTCSCTKFTNPANTILGKHPGSDCPCVACFLGSA